MNKLCTNYAHYALIMQNYAGIMHVMQKLRKITQKLRKNNAKITPKNYAKITHTCVNCIICIIMHPPHC